MGFDALVDANKDFGKKGATEGQNIAIVVESYNTEGADPTKHTVTGKALHNGETMTISLRADKDAANRRFKRAEVSNWAAKRDKAATDVGGVILFEGVFKYPQGYTAKWGNALSHTPDEASVFIAHACPVATKNKKFAFDVVRVPAARAVSTVEELEAALAEAMSPGPFSFAVVRASDGEKVTVRKAERYKKNDEGKFEQIEAAEAAKLFLTTQFGQALVANIGTGFVTEVIAGERIFAGKDTQDKLGTEEKHKRFHMMGNGAGFTPTVIAVRRHAQGGLYFTFGIPSSTQPQLYPLEGIPSAVIQPKVAPFMNNGATQEDGVDLGGAGEMSNDPAGMVAKAAGNLGTRP